MNTVCQLVRFIGPEEDVGYKLSELKEYISYAAECDRPPQLLPNNFPVEIQHEPADCYPRLYSPDEIDIEPRESGLLVEINDCFKAIDIGRVKYEKDCLLYLEYDLCVLE